MSLLPSATFAGPGTAEALWAAAGAVGPGGGVTQIVPGLNVSIDPPTGLGVVTINATGGGGGGGVTSVSNNGPGISVSPTTGAVQIENTGVTSIVAGTNVSISGSTGAVTINAPLAAAFAASATDALYTMSADAANPTVLAGVNTFANLNIPTPSTGPSQKVLLVYGRAPPGVTYRLQDYFAVQAQGLNVFNGSAFVAVPVNVYAEAFFNSARGGAVDLRFVCTSTANFNQNSSADMNSKMCRIPWNGP